MKRHMRSSVSSFSRRKLRVGGISGLFGGLAPGGQRALPQTAHCVQRKKGASRRKLYPSARSPAYHIIGRMVVGFQKEGLDHQPESPAALGRQG
jgi:hypothetical protein